MSSSLPLAGLRVVDLSRVFAMPYATGYLADLGAEVIKVEACHLMDSSRGAGPFPDNCPGELFWESGGCFQTLNRGKCGLTLDLRAESSREVLKQLVQVSDVLVENFTPRVMVQYDLDYPSLRRLKPDLIMLSNTGYGHTGPWSGYGAVASSLEPTHGSSAFMGYMDRDGQGRSTQGSVPAKIGNSYTDFLASWMALYALMACLLHRQRTGRGMWIDLGMYQLGVSLLGEGLLDFAFNGREERRIGNRHHSMSPHGGYPCKGHDEWVAIAVRDDADWLALCQALNDTALVTDPRFSDPVSRLHNQDELDAIISRWTSSRDQYEVMDILQVHGVPTGPVLDAKGLLADPHLRARGFFEATTHPTETGLGRREYIGRGWKLSACDVRIAGPAPRLGEANDYVLRELLGLSEDEIEEMRRCQVIGQEPIGYEPPVQVPLDSQVELGGMAGYDPNYANHLEKGSPSLDSLAGSLKEDRDDGRFGE